ncbi:MAG TPA: DMT family transporter [Steroidobacteraceae bacterium]|nr:DMT family transporter [Steroidobacteraceae bacterium]
MLHVIVPALFVLVWSTGFIVAKAALPHADLQLFLLLRLSITAIAMGAFAAIARGKWPRGIQIGRQLLAGVLLQGIYLCFSYLAITRGMAAGVMALLGALQPLITGLIVAIRGTKLPARIWVGLLIGFAGVICVLAPKLAATDSNALSWMAVLAAVISVLGVTAGSLLQKGLAPVDLRAAASIQNVGGAVVALVMTLVVSTRHWDNSLQLWGALSYSVGVASIVGYTLLMWMLRHGEATKVTALILLVPPLAAIQAYFFFHEILAPVQFVGFVLALAGVLLARSAGRARLVGLQSR